MPEKKPHPVKRRRAASPSKRKFTKEYFFGGDQPSPVNRQETARRERIFKCWQVEGHLKPPLSGGVSVDYIGECMELVVHVPKTTVQREWQRAWPVIKKWLSCLPKHGYSQPPHTQTKAIETKDAGGVDLAGAGMPENPPQALGPTRQDFVRLSLVEFNKIANDSVTISPLRIEPAWMGESLELFVWVPRDTRRKHWMRAWPSSEIRPVYDRLVILQNPKYHPANYCDSFILWLKYLKEGRSPHTHRKLSLGELAQAANQRLDEFLIGALWDERIDAADGSSLWLGRIRVRPDTDLWGLPSAPDRRAKAHVKMDWRDASHNIGLARALLAAVYKRSSRPSATGRQIDQIIEEALEKMRQGLPSFPSGKFTKEDMREFFRPRRPHISLK